MTFVTVLVTVERMFPSGQDEIEVTSQDEYVHFQIQKFISQHLWSSPMRIEGAAIQVVDPQIAPNVVQLHHVDGSGMLGHLGDQEVGRFDVAMDHGQTVQEGHCFRRLPQDGVGCQRGQHRRLSSTVDRAVGSP